MSVGERKVLLPVVSRDVVFARADVVADEVAHGMIGGRHVLDSQAGPAKQLVHGLRTLGSQELAARIGLQILRGTGDVDRARCNQRDQHVGVHRQVRFVPGVLAIPRAVPVWNHADGMMNSLAESPPDQGRAAFAGVVRDDDREPLVLCPGPEGGLAQPLVQIA